MRPRSDFDGNELIRFLRRLNLAPGYFVVLGSGPMWARGLRDRLNDLDIVAKGPAWRTAEWSPGAATLVSGPLSNEPMVCFLDGRIEIASTWVTYEHCLDELIESADDIHGIPFARLDHVLESKLTLNRKKDQGDISILKEELNRRPPALAGC